MKRRFQPRNFGFPPRDARNALDWTRLAQQHKLTEPRALADEVRRLHGTGLAALDISELLHLSLPVVLECLQRPTDSNHD